MRPNEFTRKNVISGIVLVVALAVIASFQACSPGFTALTPAINNSSGGRANDAPVTLSYLIPSASFTTLSQSGFNDFAEKTGVANFWEYVPRFPLFSYGAAKRRWIYLPPNTPINNANPDSWVFPKGTVLWKLFSLNGRKVETRILEKIADAAGLSSWRTSVYLWRADQTEADLLTINNFYQQPAADKLKYEAGAVEAVYKVAMPNQCMTCHQNAADGALGFNYFQLSNANNPKNVIALSQSKILTNTVVNYDEILGTDAQKAAIGYLQGNCAHCHSGAGPGPHDFKHRSTVTSAAREAVLISASLSAGLITPGDKAASRLYVRPSNGTMPPNTITADPVGYTAIGAWIDAMPRP